MTTIAYKDGIIAYDSFLTNNHIVIDHEIDKHRVVDDHHFFFSGALADLNSMINACFDKDYNIKDNNINTLVVFPNGNLFECGIDDDSGFWKTPIRKNCAFSIGSGKCFALAAMDMGKSAEEAVGIAAYRDLYTGGTIQTYVIANFVAIKKAS